LGSEKDRGQKGLAFVFIFLRPQKEIIPPLLKADDVRICGIDGCPLFIVKRDRFYINLLPLFGVGLNIQSLLPGVAGLERGKRREGSQSLGTSLEIELNLIGKMLGIGELIPLKLRKDFPGAFIMQVESKERYDHQQENGQ
jgi:hypothetical protein